MNNTRGYSVLLNNTFMLQKSKWAKTVHSLSIDSTLLLHLFYVELPYGDWNGFLLAYAAVISVVAVVVVIPYFKMLRMDRWIKNKR